MPRTTCPKCDALVRQHFGNESNFGVAYRCGSEDSLNGFEQSKECRRLENIWRANAGLDSPA